MKKIIFSFLIFFLLISLYLFFSNIDFFHKRDINKVCPAVKLTCPDEFLSTCDSIYDTLTKSCIECIPDCTGHETSINRTSDNASEIILCPDISPSPNFCKGGNIKPIYNEIGCVIDYECK